MGEWEGGLVRGPGLVRNRGKAGSGRVSSGVKQRCTTRPLREGGVAWVQLQLVELPEGERWQGLTARPYIQREQSGQAYTSCATELAQVSVAC